MSKGFKGRILRIDLSGETIVPLELSEDFYRTYLGGGAVGAYFLLKETTGDTEPLGPDNLLTIAPSVTTGANVSGVSRCSVVALSPLTEAVGEGQAGGSIGPMIKRAGFDAIVIKGKAKQLSYLYLDEDRVEIRDAETLRAKPVSEVYAYFKRQHEPRKISVIQCGPAGENRVRFASLMVDRNNVVGRTGLGAVMGSKNLRAVVVSSRNTVDFFDPEGLKQFNRLAKERLETAGFPWILKQHGTPGVVSIQAAGGNIASFNYSSGFHRNHSRLDGNTYDKAIGAGKTTCPGCIVSCRKRVRAETPHMVTDKLGGPEFETLSTLGTNLDITEITAVAKANEMCNEFGLDTITMGAMAAYLFESLEKQAVDPNVEVGGPFRFGQPEDLFRLIESVSQRKGIGHFLADGFETAIEKLGKATSTYAIHCKGQGLPAHMAQVKPSQALMYAACPIGGDHMSAEHDWFLNPEDQNSRALGIFGGGNAKSTDTAKVRMTSYSQIYYGLLDTLALCMFVWGPGNLHTYRELEDLVFFSTGWRTSLWELMKAGERKINMLRQINARRGFSAQEDVLPDRLYQPIPDGPSQGACVDRNRFPEMLKEYYQFMGWDPETGNPTPGKLLELGLEWT
jgi:aldehyde:ferredoxin oxidoreductase